MFRFIKEWLTFACQPFYFGTIGSVLSIGSGVKSIFGSSSDTQSPQAAQASADPFAPYRAGYAQELQTLLHPGYNAGVLSKWEQSQGFGSTNKKGVWSEGKLTPEQTVAKNQQISKMQGEVLGRSVTNQPGYQFELGQGTQALERAYAARGMSSSGNEQIALNEFGQRLSGQYYTDMINRLMGLSGANQNPAAGQSAYQQAQATNLQQNQAGWNSAMQGIGGLRAIYGSSGSSGGWGGGYDPNTGVGNTSVNWNM